MLVDLKKISVRVRDGYSEVGKGSRVCVVCEERKVIVWFKQMKRQC